MGAIVVVVASFVGIPISTTQCKVGGTTAVGMFGGKKGVDPLFLAKIIAGWVATFLALALSMPVFSPLHTMRRVLAALLKVSFGSKDRTKISLKGVEDGDNCVKVQ